MEVNKKEGKVLCNAIKEWRDKGVISDAEAQKLSESFTIIGFDWRKLAKYSFIIAALCVVGSVFSLLIDELFFHLITLITATEVGATIFFTVLAIIMYVWAWGRKSNYPDHTFSNETILFIAAFFVAIAIGYLGAALDSGSGHVSLLFLIALFVYIPIAIILKSNPTWLLALASGSIWYGTELGYCSDYSEYVLGMSYPFLYLLFSFFLLGIAIFSVNIPKIKPFQKLTISVGLLHFFVSMWLLSIMGNSYGLFDNNIIFIKLIWSIFLGAASFGAIFYSLKTDDHLLRIFGFTFFLLNLYTKLFEYLWENIHQTLFFGIMAISFWLVGKYAEDIWTGKFLGDDDELLDL